MESVQGKPQSAVAWSSDRQRAHEENLSALARFVKRYHAFLDALEQGRYDDARRIVLEQRAIVEGLALVAAMLLLVACGGEPFAVAGDAGGDVARLVMTSAPDAGDADRDAGELVDAEQLDAGDAQGDRPAHAGELVDAGADAPTLNNVDSGDAGDGDRDAGELVDVEQLDAGDAGDASTQACTETDAGCCEGIGPNWGAPWLGCTHNGGATWCLQSDPTWCLPAGSCACTSTAPSCCSCGMHDVRTLCAP